MFTLQPMEKSHRHVCSHKADVGLPVSGMRIHIIFIYKRILSYGPVTDSTVVECIEEYKETMISGRQKQTGMLNYDMCSCYRNVVYMGSQGFPHPPSPPPPPPHKESETIRYNVLQ